MHFFFFNRGGEIIFIRLWWGFSLTSSVKKDISQLLPWLLHKINVVKRQACQRSGNVLLRSLYPLSTFHYTA